MRLQRSKTNNNDTTPHTHLGQTGVGCRPHLPHILPRIEAILKAKMSDTSLLEAASGDGGLIAVDRLSMLLRITRGELATALGVSRDAVAKTARARTHATQARLRDMVEILNRVRRWAGSPQQAFAWYRSRPCPPSGTRPLRPW